MNIRRIIINERNSYYTTKLCGYRILLDLIKLKRNTFQEYFSNWGRLLIPSPDFDISF